MLCKYTLLVVMGIGAAAAGCLRGGFEPQPQPPPQPKPQPSVMAVYPQHAEWNAYVQNDNGGSTAFTQPDEPCGEQQTGGYSACIHSGERRKVVLPDEMSCVGLSATDALGAFNWVCDESGASVVFYSTGLRAGKGLADLLDLHAFRDNAVVVRRDGASIAQTSATVWWNNPVLELPSNTNEGVLLDSPGAIYLLSESRATHGFNVAADGISVVVVPGATLRFAGTTNNCTYDVLPTPEHPCALVTDGHDFLWFEGDFDARGALAGIFFHSSRFAVVRNFRVQNSWYGLLLVNTLNSIFTGIRIGNAERYGMIVRASAENTLSDVTVSNSGSGGGLGASGLLVEVGSHDNVFSNLLLTNNHQYGILVNNDSDRNTFSHLTLANIAYAGLELRGGEGNSVSQAVIVNCGRLGIGLGDENGVAMAQLVSAHHGEHALQMMNSTNLEIRGNVLLGVHPLACRVVGGDGSGIGAGCSDVALPASTQLITAGIDLSTSFGGKVVVDDVINATDDAGTQSYDLDRDWTHFATIHRAWGLDGSDFPAEDQRNTCVTEGTCRIWDWRLRSTDRVIFKRSSKAIVENVLFVPGDACPPAVNGDRVLTDGRGDTFVFNAVERLFDGQGDDDGLCESDEACIASPNFGRYQGEGDLVGPCVFQDGAVGGVTMYARQANGWAG
ncbi:MAG: right-handed parallel beta-helix repeat-containing protein [Deltaproteobacteria bacterium]|nr:right-handed parallel beta-helix repeat-containing protein [Deltaproteobacteria bacterium]